MYRSYVFDNETQLNRTDRYNSIKRCGKTAIAVLLVHILL